MAYRALKRLHLGNEVYVEPGEFLAQAAEWNNVQAWVNTGFIEEVSDSELPKAKSAPKDSAPASASDEVAPKTAAPKKTSARKRTKTKEA